VPGAQREIDQSVIGAAIFDVRGYVKSVMMDTFFFVCHVAYRYTQTPITQLLARRVVISFVPF